jgi:hypothetical protein
MNIAIKSRHHRCPCRVLIILLAVFSSAVAGVCRAEQIFQTTLELEEPITAAGIDRIEFVWSADMDRKHAGRNALSGLSVALFASDSLVYTDLAITDWLILPILSEESLTERTREDIFWDFSIEEMTLRQFRSILPKSLKGSSGEHYQVADNKSLQDDRRVHILHFVDGKVKERKVGMLLRQSTRLLKTFNSPDVEVEAVAVDDVVTYEVSSDPVDTADGGGVTGSRAGRAQFQARAYGLYVAELAAFGIDAEAEGAGVKVNGEPRPVLVEEGVLRFFLGKEDVGADVQIGLWEETEAMEVVDAAPVSMAGDVGFATPGEGEEVLDLPVAEGTTRYIVTEMMGDEVWLLDVSDPAHPRWLTQQAVLESPKGIAVYFETGATEIRRVLLLPPEQAFELQPAE